MCRDFCYGEATVVEADGVDADAERLRDGGDDVVATGLFVCNRHPKRQIAMICG